jgi:hypothetical protein
MCPTPVPDLSSGHTSVVINHSLQNWARIEENPRDTSRETHPGHKFRVTVSGRVPAQQPACRLDGLAHVARPGNTSAVPHGGA